MFLGIIIYLDKPAEQLSPRRLAGPPRFILGFADLQDAVFQGRGHRLVHALGFIALHKIRGVPVADEQRLQRRSAAQPQMGANRAPTFSAAMAMPS